MKKQLLGLSLGIILACGVFSACSKGSDMTNNNVASDSTEKSNNTNEVIGDAEAAIEAYKKCFEENDGVKCTLIHLNSDDIPEFIFCNENEECRVYTYSSKNGLIRGDNLSPDINGFVAYLKYNENTETFAFVRYSYDENDIDKGALILKIADDCEGFTYLAYLVGESDDDGQVHSLLKYSFDDSYKLINPISYECNDINYDKIYSDYGNRLDFKRIDCDYNSVEAALNNLK